MSHPAGPKIPAIALAVLALAACGSTKTPYQEGYEDGFATGYNTECGLRATLIEGAWRNEDYSAGFADGETRGHAACREDREAGTIRYPS